MNKRLISFAAVAALGVGMGGCNSNVNSIKDNPAKDVGISAKKVEFIGMEAPSTVEDMAKTYSTAKVHIYTTETEYTEHNLSYHTLFNVKDKIGTNPHAAGQLYNYKMEPIMDPMGKPVLAETPDSNSLLNVEGRLFLVSHLEYDWILSDGTSAYKYPDWYSRMPMSMLLTSIEQDANGNLIAKEQKPIDFSSVDGLWIPCFGSQTPWNTHLGSEEDYDLYFTAASGEENSNSTMSGLKAMSEVYYKDTKIANPYHYGYITEVEVKSDASAKPIKHYSMGRGTWEMSKIMPDGKTAFFGDDGTNVGLYMYVADKADNITAGTLYAAKWNQTSTNGAKDGGSANLTWIKLGHATDAEAKGWADKYTFSDIFDALTPAEVEAGTDTTGYTAIKAGHTGVEYLKLKAGMENIAAHLELRRFAAIKGATTEWNKMEGVTVNTKDKKLYIAISYIDKGMKQDDSFTKDDIRIAKNNCGGTYELSLKNGIKDTQGNAINSEYVATDMHVPTALLGQEIDMDEYGNTCMVDKIANTDNIFFSDKMRTLFVGEDSGTHTNNFVWAYNVDSKKLSRILSVPAGGESTGLQVVDNENGYAYIMSNAQHLADFTKTTPEALQEELKNKIDKFNAPFGYLGGIPGLK